ncbi:MAG: cell division protein ZapA [Spirochaetales bacterium]|uniref:Cell division protein ZapA n=1 Tax=Candidatus Thalassospirochaeta sargassi TaxID=3119039 RepID=A0AAJ1ICG4_9SPIO|nr:cell division protein ZapA [Spirochaetales bacterium]
MNKNLFQINVLGSSFSIQTDEDPARMDEIISILKSKTEMVEKDLSVKDPLKNLVISSIIIIDELLKGKQKGGPYENSDSEEVERLTLQIMEKIDKSLE